MSAVVFVDTETTGLDPDRHGIWEVALIWWGKVWQPDEHDRMGRGKEVPAWCERTWHLPVDLGQADAYALKLTDFHERYGRQRQTSLKDFARDFARLTRGKHLCGAVPSFDEERLRRLLQANGACPEWHYHLIDVEALVVGYLAARGKTLGLPWDSESLSRAVGVEPFTDRHEALADARWAKALYERILAAPSTPGTSEGTER